MDLKCAKCDQLVSATMPFGDTISIKHEEVGDRVRHKIIVTTEVQVDPKPKSVVEQIWETHPFVRARDPYWEGSAIGKLAAALAEAVERTQKLRDFCDSRNIKHTPETLESILAILKGEKTRGIPKP